MTSGGRPVTERSLPAAISGWHQIVASGDASAIPDLLAPEVVFRSPAVFTPQRGAAHASRYLSAAIAVLGPSLRYEREWYDGSSGILEFVADLDRVSVHGIDLIAWNSDGLITEFTVMVRPLRGLTTLIDRMGAELARS